MNETTRIPDDIAEFVLREITIDKSIAHDDDLIESDLLDSTGIVALLAFLEERFTVQIDEDVDLVLDNFRTIDAIAAFVVRKMSGTNQE
jgi:acyl carrier protein